MAPRGSCTDISMVHVNTLAGTRAMRISFTLATPADAPEIALLRNDAAHVLTDRHGRGHWSGETSERGVELIMRNAQVWVARRGRTIVGTFRLAAKKP